jgi:hypothetical protein
MSGFGAAFDWTFDQPLGDRGRGVISEEIVGDSTPVPVDGPNDQ